LTKENNIEMTHEEHRNLKKELFGVKRFNINSLKCTYLGKCNVIFKNNVYCCSLKYNKCIQYLVYKIRDINRRVKANQGHLNNDTRNGNLIKNGKCIINATEKHTLSLDKKDAGELL